MLIDLHRHLEGTLRVATTVELAQRYGHRLADPEFARDQMVAGGPMGGLVPFLAKVDVAVSAFQALDDWNRAARECVEDAAADGLDYIEIRFCPAFIALETGLPAEAVMDAVADGARIASSRTGLRIALIAIVLRDLGPERGQEQMAALLGRRDLLCAVDIAGNEAGVPVAEFAAPFRAAREAGLHVTVHAGEAAGAFSVWDAVNHLGAERIGHGIRSVEDPALLEVLAARGITLEVSLTSNVHTSGAASYAEHPVLRLKRAGVPVVLCTDDPRASAITLSEEYASAAPQAGLTAADLQDIRIQARTAAFALTSG
jgi:adenosine deaminase